MLFICCRDQFTHLLLRISAFIFIKSIGFFLWFWYQGYDGPLEWIWKLAMNLFFIFLILWEEQILAPLCYVGSISLWGHLVLDICLLGGFLFLFLFFNYKFRLTTSDQLFKLFLLNLVLTNCLNFSISSKLS